MVSPDPQDQRHRRLSAVSCIDDDANNAEKALRDTPHIPILVRRGLLCTGKSDASPVGYVTWLSRFCLVY